MSRKLFPSSENYSRQASKAWNESVMEPAVLVNLYAHHARIFFNIEVYFAFMKRVLFRADINVRSRRKRNALPGAPFILVDIEAALSLSRTRLDLMPLIRGNILAIRFKNQRASAFPVSREIIAVP
jgi:hypothetical protein